MAYIKKRGESRRAEVRGKGYKPTYRTFDTQAEALKWARRVEAEIDAGSYIDNSEAERTTLGLALERYRKDVAAKNRVGKLIIQMFPQFLGNQVVILHFQSHLSSVGG
jgi:hypothetical protein